MKKIILIITGLILISGCVKQTKEEVKIEGVSVVTSKPFISDIVLTTTLQGTILPIKEAKISSKMGGQLSRIFVKENADVKEGQIYFSSSQSVIL